jgi:hypothetical protein
MEHEMKAQKLLELRTKTDRQLTALIGSLLDRGLSAEAERLLPALRGANRLCLELKLNRVKELSSRKSVYAA